MKINIICISIVLSILAAFAATAKADEADIFVQAQMRQLNIPGLSLAVVRDGKTVKATGYGLADVENNLVAAPETVYEIGSVTKQFTATAVMMLAQDKKIILDDEISKYLFDLPEGWRAITVRQLMNQTSGLPEYYENPSRQTVAGKDVIKIAAAASPKFTPGDGWNYSNTNHYLLGLIIEKASGKSYGDFLRERIFAPLGMSDTRYNDRRAIIKNRARGYDWDWGKAVLYNNEFLDVSWAFAAGGIVSTVNDLAKWDAALYTDALVNGESKRQMWTAGKLKSGISHRYGFGWYVERINGHLNLSHGGDIPGFATYVTRYPDDKLTVIVCLNQYIYAKRIADTIAAMYLPDLIYREISDRDPKFTELIKNLYENRAAGKSDLWKEELFTPERWKSLKATLADQNDIDFYKRLGSPQSVKLVERIDDEKGLLTRYRIKYGITARLARFVRNADGKITEWEDYEQ